MPAKTKGYYRTYFTASVVTLIVSVIFALVIILVFNLGTTMTQTRLGFIYLGRYAQKDYDDVLNEQIPQWQDEAQYDVEFQGVTHRVDLNLFTFDLTSTIDNIVKNGQNQAYFSLTPESQATLTDQLVEDFSLPIINSVNIDAFLAEINNDISFLYDHHTYHLATYIDASLAENIITTKNIDNLAPADVTNISTRVSVINIAPMARFSLLSHLNGMGLTNNQLSIIASGIQYLSLESNFSGYVFQSNTTLPSWAGTAFNVRILAVNGFDFSFYNDLDYSFTVAISALDADSISMSLKGYPYLSTYHAYSTVEQVVSFNTIYNEDLTLGPATPGVIVSETATDFIYRVLDRAGTDGEVSYYYRDVTTPTVDPYTIRLFSEQILPIDAIYRENIVAKGA